MHRSSGAPSVADADPLHPGTAWLAAMQNLSDVLERQHQDRVFLDGQVVAGQVVEYPVIHTAQFHIAQVEKFRLRDDPCHVFLLLL